MISIARGGRSGASGGVVLLGGALLGGGALGGVLLGGGLLDVFSLGTLDDSAGGPDDVAVFAQRDAWRVTAG